MTEEKKADADIGSFMAQTGTAPAGTDPEVALKSALMFPMDANVRKAAPTATELMSESYVPRSEIGTFSSQNSSPSDSNILGYILALLVVCPLAFKALCVMIEAPGSGNNKSSWVTAPSTSTGPNPYYLELFKDKSTQYIPPSMIGAPYLYAKQGALLYKKDGMTKTKGDGDTFVNENWVPYKELPFGTKVYTQDLTDGGGFKVRLTDTKDKGSNGNEGPFLIHSSDLLDVDSYTRELNKGTQPTPAPSSGLHKPTAATTPQAKAPQEAAKEITQTPAQKKLPPAPLYVYDYPAERGQKWTSLPKDAQITLKSRVEGTAWIEAAFISRNPDGSRKLGVGFLTQEALVSARPDLAKSIPNLPKAKARILPNHYLQNAQ